MRLICFSGVSGPQASGAQVSLRWGYNSLIAQMAKEPSSIPAFCVSERGAEKSSKARRNPTGWVNFWLFCHSSHSLSTLASSIRMRRRAAGSYRAAVPWRRVRGLGFEGKRPLSGLLHVYDVREGKTHPNGRQLAKQGPCSRTQIPDLHSTKIC